MNAAISKTEQSRRITGRFRRKRRFARGRTNRNALIDLMEYKSAASPTKSLDKLTMVPLEQLTQAKFVPPATIILEFADRRCFALAIEKLEVPIDQFDWATLTVSPEGEKVVVKDAEDDLIPFDAAAFRYLVDKLYAAKVDRSIASRHMTPAEQTESAMLSLLTRDPRWHDVGDEQ